MNVAKGRESQMLKAFGTIECFPGAFFVCYIATVKKKLRKEP